MLKFSGYDHLIVSGRSQAPVYLEILDDEVEFRDACHICGGTDIGVVSLGFPTVWELSVAVNSTTFHSIAHTIAHPSI